MVPGYLIAALLSFKCPNMFCAIAFDSGGAASGPLSSSFLLPLCIGLPVPQGFTITTEACTQYYEDGREINDSIKAEVTEYIAKLEKITGKTSVYDSAGSHRIRRIAETVRIPLILF